VLNISILTSRSSVADAFPQIEVAIISIVPGYSSATVLEFHELPCAKNELEKSLLGYPEKERLSIYLFGCLEQFFLSV